MNFKSSLAAATLAAMLSGAAGCATYNPQRIDNLAGGECGAQVQQGIEQMLVDNKEPRAVAHTLAVSAMQDLLQQVANMPRPNSRLAADLRVLTSKTRFASNSGVVYEVYANQDRKGCMLRLTTPTDLYLSEGPLPACVCEPGQDD
jgi:hypothetical protein